MSLNNIVMWTIQAAADFCDKLFEYNCKELKFYVSHTAAALVVGTVYPTTKRTTET